MGQYRKILLVVDSQLRRTPALLRAAQLAKRCGGALHIVMITHDRTISMLERSADAADGRARTALLEKLGLRMAELRRFVEQITPRVTTDMIYDDHPQRALTDYVGEMRPDLVVKDVHHESKLARLLLTPADWSLARSTPVPVLLVNSASAGNLRRVIAAVDSVSDRYVDANDKVVRAAEALALQCDAGLELAHVLEIPQPATFGAPEFDLGTSASIFRIICDQDQQWFTDYAVQHGVPVENRHLLIGHAPDALVAYADHCGSDVLVMGSRQRKSFDRALLGSTTEDTLTKARCDVLVVPCGATVQ